MSINSRKIKSILFDLDGTLVDTYKDLRNAANYVLNLYNFSNIDHIIAKKLATDGMIAMLSAGMGPRINDFDQNLLKKQFLSYYSDHICDESTPFVGILDLLDECRAHSIKWGIVTNKPSFLTKPLVNSISEFADCSVIVCSDDIPEKKPAPEPLLHALELQGISFPNQCIYVGDHIRDVQCGINAGACTIAAAWGYISENDNLEEWKSNFIAKTPIDIIEFCKKEDIF